MIKTEYVRKGGDVKELWCEGCWVADVEEWWEVQDILNRKTKGMCGKKAGTEIHWINLFFVTCQN